MTITAEITDGVTTFDLVYDAASQPNYHARKNLRLVTEDTDVLQHRPDNDSPVPIRAIDLDSTVFLTKDVLGDTVDEVLNKIAEIKRFVDGKNQQALRYWTDGDVNRVDLKLQRQSATNYTLHPIKWGHVDDSEAHYTAEAQNSQYAIGILVTLHLTPHGEGVSFPLRNDLPNSPGMLQGTGGYAYGLSAVGTPSPSLNTTRWLIGGQSQAIITDASTAEGYTTEYVTAATDDPFSAFVWISANDTGNDIIKMTVQVGGASNYTQKEFNPSSVTGYDKTVTDSAGNAWYRYSFSDDGSPARGSTNVRFRIARELVNATQATTFFTDGLYIHVGDDTIPDGWCSTSSIQNRNDFTATSSTTQARINYIDVWGISGDSDALITTTTNGTITGTKDALLAARMTDGAVSVAGIGHWTDSGNMTWTLTTGSNSSPSDASRAGGGYTRYTAAATPADGQLNVFPAVGSDAYLDFFSISHRLFLIARSSRAATSFEWATYPGIVKVGGQSASFNAANTWELIDVGYILAIDKATYDNFTASAVSGLPITVTPGAGSATVDVDAALILPAGAGEYCVISNASVGSDIVIVGSEKTAIPAGAFSDAPSIGGSFWTIPAGNRMSRLIFGATNSETNVHHITDTLDVSLTVTPRTRHLLGTI